MNTTASVRNLRRLAGALALLVLLFALLFGWQAWRSARQEQITQMRTALELGQNAIDSYFSQVQASLHWLSLSLVPAGQPLAEEATLSRQLRHFQGVHPEFATVSLLAPDGLMLASSQAPGPGGWPNSADEASWQRFKEELTPETRLSLGRPSWGSVGKRWVTPLRYVARDTKGQAAYVLTAAVPVELLQQFWTDAPITARASMGLIRDDGYLISRYPVPPSAVLEEVYGKPRTGALSQHLKAEGYPRTGYVEGMNQLGGVPAGSVYQRLVHFPVTVFVTMPTHEFRSAWWQRVQVPFALLLLLSLGGWAGYRYTLKRQNDWDGERRRTEAELRTSEAEQRFLIDHMLAGVIVHGADGAVLLVNERACELTDLTADQMLGRAVIDPLWHFVREDGSRMPIEEYPVPRTQRTRQAVADLVLGVVPAAGAEPKWLIVNAYPEFNADASIRQIIVTFVDISARRRVEQALKQSENRYRMLFENSMDAVMQTRPDGRILAANEAACRMFGMSEAELVSEGRSRIIDPEDPRLARLLALRERSGHAAGELTMRRGDGSRFEAEVASAVYTDASGQALTSLVVRDVTERRQTEASERARDLAERASRAKSDFIARMSHELRTPLNAILGFAAVLEHDEAHPLAPLQRERLAHVQRAGDHLLLLINDLLDLSRIEAGRLAIATRPLDVLASVDDAVAELAPQANAAGVTVVVQPPAAPLPRVQADPMRLRQVVLNLVSNAIKYNRPGGSVTLRLSASVSELQLSVEDTGLGMDEQQLSGLFQPFNRLGREEGNVEGTGIGLVIARSLLELMCGRLEVRSRAGAGSVFSFSLPLAAPAGAVPRAAPACEPALPQASERVAGELIYIDDDEVNQALMQAFMVRRPAVRLRLAGDGRTGIEMALALPPQLMLIDMMMPGLDGTQVLAAVRAQPLLRGVRCVAVSANAMPGEIAAALAAGFDGYLTKPLSLQLLLQEIDLGMGGGDTTPAPGPAPADGRMLMAKD
jgi:PAS domain S-box-containing protein